MKLSLCIVFPAAVLALSHSEAPKRRMLERSKLLDPRQFKLPTSILPEAPIGKIETLQPTIRPDAVRKRIYYGPFVVPGTDYTKPKSGQSLLSMDPDSTTFLYTMSPPCSDCTALSGQNNIFFPNGTRADIAHGMYQHHVITADLRNRNLPLYFCPGNGLMSLIPGTIFTVSGNDPSPGLFTSVDGQFPSGYLFRDDSNLNLEAELVNYNKWNESVYITQEVEYLNGIKPGTKDASISVLSATDCGNPSYNSKGGAQNNMTSSEKAMPGDGYLLSSRGHLHDGGVSLELTVNGKGVCNSVATYGGGAAMVTASGRRWQTITGMSQCAQPLPLKKGDMMGMTSVYDTHAHPLRESVHGQMQDEMGLYFIAVALDKKTTK